MSASGLSKMLSFLGYRDRDLIMSLIASAFMVDFGVVTAVSADGATVDVQHLVMPKVAGEQLGATETKGVELLWLGGGAAFVMQWAVAPGDPVLLVGLKDFVKTVKGAAPAIPDVPLHYTQETMKAIPLGVPAAGSPPAQGAAMATGGGVPLQSDLTTDPTAWPILTTLAAVFGMTLTSLKAGWH